MGTSCPRCGSSNVRLLSPGYFQCEGDVLVDVVPRGVNGNPSEIPLRRRCGHRFQTGAGDPRAPQCSCGMFSVGICRICGEPSCGVHGSVSGDVFVCNVHIAEAGRQAAAEEFRRKAEKQRMGEEAARQAADQRAEMRDARAKAFPELPVEGGATAEQLSAGLCRHAADRKASFVIERKSLGRTTTVRGWGFTLASDERSNAYGGRYYSHRGLIVTDDGRAYVVEERSSTLEWAPGDHRHGPPPSQTDSIGERGAQIVIGHVMGWAGGPTGHAATPARAAHLGRLIADGRISREEADRIAPDGNVSDAAWAAIRDR